MQCPACGAESVYGSSFCKQCGAALTPPKTSVEKAIRSARSTGKLSGMFWAIAVFALLSFTVLFGITIPLTIFQADGRLIAVLIAVGCAGIFGVAAMLVKQLSRLITIAQEGDRVPQPRALKPPTEFGHPQLDAAPPGMASVTEHTTRNFEPVYREPGARE